MTLRVKRWSLGWGASIVAWLVFWHLLMYWQVWLDPTTLVQGPMGDNLVMIWNVGWVWHALESGHAGFWFPTAYFPSDFFFLYGTHTWLDAVLGFPFRNLLGEMPYSAVLWVNIVQLLATIGTGLGVSFALSQWGVRSRSVRLLGLSLVTFCWFRSFAASGHYHFYGTEWMVWSLALLSAARRRLYADFFRASIGWAVAGGLVLGLTFLNDQTHTVFAVVLSSILLLSMLPRGGMIRTLGIGAAYFLTFLISASLHIVPLLQALLSGRFEYSVANLHLPRLVDASSLLLPNDWHLWSADIVREVRGDYRLTISEGSYFGLIQWMSIIGIGVWLAYAFVRERLSLQNPVLWIWAVACGFLILAFGERLKIGDEVSIVLPGRILREVPVLNNIRLPQRWIWPAQLCTALALCLWIQRVLLPYRHRLGRILLICLAGYSAAEGKFYPPPNPMSIDDPMLDPPGLIEGMRKSYKGGGIYPMPVWAAYAHNNYLQLRLGYDYPMSLTYTARAPFPVTQTPWKGPNWNDESTEFMRQKQVGMIVFPYHEGTCDEWYDWIKAAKSALPDLVVINKGGEEVR